MFSGCGTALLSSSVWTASRWSLKKAGYSSYPLKRRSYKTLSCGRCGHLIKQWFFQCIFLTGILFVYLTFPTFLLLHVTVDAWQSDLCFRCHNTRSRSPRTWPDSWAGRLWAPAPRWACQTWNPQGLPPPLFWQPQTKRGNSNLFTYHYCNTSFILFGVRFSFYCIHG